MKFNHPFLIPMNFLIQLIYQKQKIDIERNVYLVNAQDHGEYL